MTLHVPSFAGGVVLEGAADTRKIDEVLVADALDIGPRGALIAASDRTPYTVLEDFDGNPWSRLYGILSTAGLTFGASTLAVGEGTFAAASPVAIIMNSFARQGAPDPLPLAAGGVIGSHLDEGVVVTGAIFAGLYTVRFAAPGMPPPNPAVQIPVYLLNVGAREGFAPRTAPGLRIWTLVPGSGVPSNIPIQHFDALGTGDSGELPVGGGNGGTHGKQLYFRGILVYNNHALGWGFDNADATNGDGPTRVMFCNLGLPLKWGNDNQAAAGTDRSFTDSDAIEFGGAGEIIRCGYVWAGKCWFGTNRGLHYIAGYGRDSFLTDGATPVMNAFNVVGPYALIEGPDRMLYGVAEQGLWRFNGAGVPEPLFRRLVDFSGRSSGFWDCIWADPSRAATYPGRTNQDLVWTAVDWERRQVLVGIPWCNSGLGYGYGQDTVVVKFHVDTGGFSRQVFQNVQLSAAGYFRREAGEPGVRFLGTATSSEHTIQRYGFQSSPAVAPVLPSVLPVATVGPYVPFGPDGEGVIRRVYLTLSWQNISALPIVFQITTAIDQAQVDTFALYLQPLAPVAIAGDLWLDTSQSDSSLGNAVAGATVPARGGYLLKTLNEDGDWLTIAGQGAKGTRVTVQLPLSRVTGTRLTTTATCTSAAGRFQLEGFGINPGEGEPSA